LPVGNGPEGSALLTLPERSRRELAEGLS